MKNINAAPLVHDVSDSRHQLTSMGDQINFTLMQGADSQNFTSGRNLDRITQKFGHASTSQDREEYSPEDELTQKSL